MQLRYPHVRSYAVVRSAHLERARDFAPASILYADRRYDFDATLATELDLHACGTLGVAAALLQNPATTAVEINEPLQLDALLRSLAALVATRIAGLRGRRPLLVAYAIENRDPFDRVALVDASTSATGRLGRLKVRTKLALQRRAAACVAGGLDRIAFGTPGAAELYRERLGGALRRTEQSTVPALPAPCTCLRPRPIATHDPDRVLFVGALHRRKGILELLAAWPTVLAARPTARLTVIGSGELLTEVRDAAAGPASAGSIEVIVDPPREQIHAAQRGAAVVVLLSRPTPRWREQVGLPIVEGLAHGCTVVTTTETGLADWLAAHGHRVLAADASIQQTAAAVVEALAVIRSADDVLADLPTTDGRRTADDWLLPSEAPAPSTVGGRTDE